MVQFVTISLTDDLIKNGLSIIYVLWHDLSSGREAYYMGASNV